MGDGRPARPPRVRRAPLSLALSALAWTLAVPAPARGESLSDPEYIVDAWDTDQGLPESSATAMVRTPDGYLWFGTFNGLVRFDGMRFTVFDRSNTPELPSPGIVNLHLDRSGRLWVSTLLGMASVKDGRWTRFGEASGWSGNYARFFAEGASGPLYVTTFDGKLLRFQGERFEVLPRPPGPPQQGFAPHLDETGVLWAVNPHFIGSLVDGKWQDRIPAAPLVAADPQQGIMAGSSRDGALWIATRDHLRKYRGDRLVSEVRAPWPLRGLWSLNEDSAGAVWICSHSHGVYRFTPDGRWRHFTTGSGLSYHAARFVFEDPEGNRWIGTSGGGLLRFKRRLFVNWGQPQGLPERVVKSITADPEGRIFMGTHGQGVARLEGTRITPVVVTGKPQSVGLLVLSTLVDRQGRLWIGSVSEGLYRVDKGATEAFFTGRFAGPTGTSVYSLFEDLRGGIWMGLDDNDFSTHEGATCFSGGQFRTYRLEGSPPLNTVRCFAQDPGGGILWAGTRAGGLYRHDGERFVPVREAAALANDRITSLLADRDGTLWIGTEDGGLACLRKGRLTRISEDSGLPARSIGAILDDQMGNLWLASNRGILRVPRTGLEALLEGRPDRPPLTPMAGQAEGRTGEGALVSQVFNLSDGLASVECTTNYHPAAVRARDGRLWFATLKGAAVVDPREFRPNTLPPPLVIEEVLIDGRPAAGRGPFMTSAAPGPASVSVPPGAKRLEIHYAGLSFTAPEKVRYRYTLEGLDREWIDVGGRRVAYLQDLKPGSYQFRVKAANNDGVWNEAGVTLPLAVQPFLWQTLWFRALAVSALLGAVVLAAVLATRGRLQRGIARLEHERALERERAQLASVLETTSDLVGFTDLSGTFVYLNPAGRRMVGLSATADVRGRKIADFQPAWATERILKEGFFGAIRDGTWSSETALLHPDGHEIPLSQVIVAHWDSEGTVDFVSTIARDISEQKRAEQALREAEDKYRKIFENAVEGVFQTTPRGRYLVANPAMARILGYGSVAELLAETTDFDTQFHLERERQPEFKRLMEERGGVQGFTARAFRRDGAAFWVSLNVRGVHDDRGTLLYYEGTAEDVTERKRNEEAEREWRAALEKAALQWELTFDSMESPIMIVDAASRVVRLNRAAMELSGPLTPPEAVGRTLAEMGSGQPWQKADELAAVAGQSLSATHGQVRDPDSGRTWDLTAGPAVASAGAEGMVVIVARDLTPMVDLQESLRRSETLSAMGSLVAGVAHEVRNPLFGISSSLDAFEAGMGRESRFNRLVTNMRTEVNRLTALMQDLLDYGKPLQSVPSPAAIDSVVAEAVGTCASLAGSREVAIVNAVADGFPPLPLDRKRLVQVFQNLLQNAIQHSPAGGVVTVAATREGGEGGPWVVLTVEDAGPGFAPEDLPRVFEPFFSRRRGGTGLGLAIVHRIVEEHGGAVSVANRPQGGAVISIRLACVGARGRTPSSGRVAS